MHHTNQEKNINEKSFKQGIRKVEDFAIAKAAGCKLFEIIDQVPSIDSSSDAGHKPERMNGEVEFKNVNFSYPSTIDEQVVRMLA